MNEFSNKFQVCLFGNEELSLKNLIRSNLPDEEILEKIEIAVKGKRKQHAGNIYFSGFFFQLKFKSIKFRKG